MALRWIGLLIGSVGAASLGCTVDHRSAQGHTLEGEIIAKPKHYNCHRADRPVVVDGRLNDSSWEQAPWTDEFVDIQGDQHPTPRFKTRAKMLWDADYLYVGAVLEEPHVWGTLTDRDAVIYADNDFEVFIDPDGDARDYYEIEVNALNTVFDLLLDKPYRRGGKATITWDLAGLQSGVHVDGTLNDVSDRDAGWSVELALPWSSLAEHARKPVPPRHGDQWRVNFSRVQWQHTVDGGHYQKRPGIAEDNWVWSVQGAIDMHIPEHWGYVEFMSGKAERSVAGVTVDERQTATDSSSRRVWPAKAAGQPQDCATLEFEILGDDGLPMPGRLTFIGEEGAGADLFPNTQVMPEELAIRSNVIYTRSGRGSVTVPPGKYNIYASRGLEWSIAGRELELRAGRRHQFTARLRREVDTSGWICGDFHLHTLTYSGHGDSNMTERVITFLGEGLEFVVATDHNHHTDYHPILRKLGVEDRLTAVTGNEVSVPIGHFNAFPLEPNRPIPPKDSDNAGTLFKLLRAEPNRYDVVPVIQLNHPRWSGIDYFGKAELDPLTGVSNSAIYGEDFDSVEVFNENEGWGYYDAEAVGQVDTGSNRHWVLRDWFNLLNRGHRYAAVGNSDSHTVYSTLAGYPRNYVISSTDDPGQIDVAEVTRAIRNKQLFTTIGPFVEYWVDGRRTGEDVMASNGSIDLRIKVQAASWIDCDRVKIVVNGDVVREIAVPNTRNPLRLDTTIALPVPRDGWLVLLIEGDDSLAPVVHDKARPILPR